MDVQLRRARPRGRQPRQPGVEPLVGALAGFGPGNQVKALDPLHVLGDPAGGQLVANEAPALGCQGQEVVPGPARARPGDRVRNGELSRLHPGGAVDRCGVRRRRPGRWSAGPWLSGPSPPRARPEAGPRQAGSRRRAASARAWPESSRWRFTNVPPGLSRSRISSTSPRTVSEACLAAIRRGRVRLSWSARSRPGAPSRALPSRLSPGPTANRLPTSRPRTTSRDPAILSGCACHDGLGLTSVETRALSGPARSDRRP